MLAASLHKRPELLVETKTTGFASPAADYAEKRLDVGELIAPNPLSVYYFKVGPGIKNEHFHEGDILAIDRSEDPKEGDFCLGSNTKGEFSIYRYGIDFLDLWGKITWIIRRANG